MKPGQVVSVDKKGTFRLQADQPIKPAGQAWQAHSFSFANTSLQEIAYQVEENFGVKVQLDDLALARRRISGEYRADNASELLQAVAQVLGLEVVQVADGWVIREE